MGQIVKLSAIVVVVLLLGWGTAYGQEGAVDLLAALDRGQIWAQFRGAGPDAVQGMVGRTTYGPSNVSIGPGTQFWGQRGGVQGMTTLGAVNIDLSGQRMARVRIPVACTNIGLRTPTPTDVMVAAPCPDQRMRRLAGVIARRQPPHPAAQLAVWAVANNPPEWQIDRYLREVVGPGQPAVARKREELVVSAEKLLRAAGLSPIEFRMFR